MIHILFLFYLFAKIGIFTFGGGYAMIPLFQYELVVNHQFINAEEFAAMVALAQLTPGPVGLNAATYIGFQQGGVLGALAGTAGIMVPSLTVGLSAAVFMHNFRENRFLKMALFGIRPAMLGLIAAAVIFFAEISIFTAPLSNLWTVDGAFGVRIPALLIFCVVLAVRTWKKVNIIWLLLGSAIAGALIL
ncbi:MAG: chromate transporter [Victivallaceae bacterium]|nr:chromate transporter [Victivallaceae bacterium]